MNHRYLAPVTLLVVMAAVVWPGLTPVAGQAPAPAARTVAAAPPATPYTPPRTADGQPDLQGFWSSSTYVPLERPNNVTKEFYTPAEAEEAMKRAAVRDAEQTEPGTTPDVHYDFTQFGLDKSQHTIVQNLRTSLIVDPPDGKMPAPTPEAVKRAQDNAAARKQSGGQYDRVQNMPNGSRCIIMGGAGPPLRDAGYNSNYQIVQSPGAVMILTEMIHDVRIVHLDGRPAPPEHVRSWTGYSRGRWEGNTLVVETTNFNGRNPYRGGRGGGAPQVESSPNMKVIERFTRASDDTIEYTFTIDDPATWTRPFTALAPLQKTIGPIFEFACHESNYGIANILAGARADEKRAAEAAQKKGSN